MFNSRLTEPQEGNDQYARDTSLCISSLLFPILKYIQPQVVGWIDLVKKTEDLEQYLTQGSFAS